MSKAPTPLPPSAAPGAHKRLTDAEWATAKAEFELGQKTATQLAREHGVRRNTMTEGLKRLGAVYGCKSKIVEQAAIDATKSDATKRVEEVRGMKDNQRKLIETTQKLAAKIMMDAIKDNVPISQKAKDVATLKNMMAIFSAGRSELWEIYGLNDDKDVDEELPEFAVSEYTPDEIAEITRQQQGETLTPDEALAELERQAAEDADGDDPLAGLLSEDD